MRKMFSENQVKELSNEVLDENLVNDVNAGIQEGDIVLDKINSGEATNGQILTADGTGGSTWEDMPEPQATKIYLHQIQIVSGSDVKIVINLWNTSPTPYTLSSLLSFLRSNGLTTRDKGLLANGVFKNSGTSYVSSIVFGYDDSTLRITGYTSGSSGSFSNHDVSESDTFADIVIEM